MMTVSRLQCTHCGAYQSENDGDYPILIIDETNADALVDFLSGKFETVYCKACNQSLDVRPTIAVKWDHPSKLYFVLGSGLEEVDRKKVFSKIIQSAKIPSKCLKSTSELRENLYDRIGHNILQFNKAIGPRMQKNWRVLVPEVFSSILIASKVKVPGIFLKVYKNGVVKEIELEESQRALAQAQFQAWLAMCEEWGVLLAKGASLERDLCRYIDNAILITGSVEMTLEAIDICVKEFEKNSPETHQPIFHLYCIEAIRASLYNRIQKANPKANEWANLFFLIEGILRYDQRQKRKRLSRLVISDKRALETIDFQSAWDVVANKIKEHFKMKRDQDPSYSEKFPLWDDLEDIVMKIGYPDIVFLVVTKGVNLSASKDYPIEHIIRVVRETVEPSGDNIFPLHYNMVARYLVQKGRADDLEKVADTFLEIMVHSNESQARIESWLGAFLKEMRQPLRLIRRIGISPRNWEFSLPVELRIDLWLERSNALRLMGKKQEAIEIIYQIIPLLESMPEKLTTVKMNLAILLRETGSPDQALAILESEIEKVSIDPEHISLLHSLSVTCILLGQPEKALNFLQHAVKNVGGSGTPNKPLLLASLSNTLSILKRYSEALGVLEELSSYDNLQATTIQTEATTWINILSNAPDLLDEKARNNIDLLLKKITADSSIASNNDDIQAFVNASYLNVIYQIVSKSPNSVNAVQEAYEIYKRSNQPVPPLVLQLMAYFYYLEGSFLEAHKFLYQIPESLADQIGGVNDISYAFQVGLDLPDIFNNIKSYLIELDLPFPDVRFITELSRENAGRSQLLRQNPIGKEIISILSSNGLEDEALHVLRPQEGSVHVMDWFDNGGSFKPFLTKISSDGSIRSRWLSTPGFNEEELAKKITTRLRGWHRRRPGDPFHIPEWHDLEQWLQGELCKDVDTSDHIIFLEHHSRNTIPWHVAVSSKWSSSYSPSWTSLEFSRLIHRKPIHTLGALMVPRYNESRSVYHAMEGSYVDISQLADRLGTGFVSAKDVDCDREAFIKILNEADFVQILCHGYVNQDNEISLMIANNGNLPLADSVASNSKIGRQHRISWKELQNLSHSPQVVFSAACSSGLTQNNLLGEQLGIYKALSNAGTKSLIAPMWDIVAEDFLPILNLAGKYFLEDNQTLAKSVYNACKCAESKYPYWIAWALSLQGDWI